MNVLFIHDHKFRYGYKKYYSPGGLSQEVLRRYTEIFTSIKIIARKINSTNVEGCSEISDENILFRLIDCESIFDILFKYYKKTKKVIEKNIKKYDIIILRVPSFLAFMAIKYVKKYKKTYVIEVVNCGWDVFWNYGIVGKIIAPIIYLYMKYIIKKCNNVIYITEKYLQNRYPCNNNTAIIPNVLIKNGDIEVLNNRIKRINDKKDKNEKIIISTIGSYDVRYKGQRHVLQALAKLKKNNCFEYLLVGQGKGDSLKKLVKKLKLEKIVRFVGTIPHDKIYSFLDNIDIYIQPSDVEAQGRSLLEAVSRSCLAISSNAGGMPEFINQNWIFPKRNVKKLVKLLENIDYKNMIISAKENYNVSNKYLEEVIQNKRKEYFWGIIDSLGEQCENFKSN